MRFAASARRRIGSARRRTRLTVSNSAMPRLRAVRIANHSVITRSGALELLQRIDEVEHNRSQEGGRLIPLTWLIHWYGSSHGRAKR